MISLVPGDLTRKCSRQLLFNKTRDYDVNNLKNIDRKLQYLWLFQGVYTWSADPVDTYKNMKLKKCSNLSKWEQIIDSKNGTVFYFIWFSYCCRSVFAILLVSNLFFFCLFLSFLSFRGLKFIYQNLTFLLMDSLLERIGRSHIFFGFASFLFFYLPFRCVHSAVRMYVSSLVVLQNPFSIEKYMSLSRNTSVNWNRIQSISCPTFLFSR